MFHLKNTQTHVQCPLSHISGNLEDRYDMNLDRKTYSEKDTFHHAISVAQCLSLSIRPDEVYVKS